MFCVFPVTVKFTDLLGNCTVQFSIPYLRDYNMIFFHFTFIWKFVSEGKMQKQM